MSEPESPHLLSRRTTPTWEVELLISGVAVFAMLQLPGKFDDLLFRLGPRFDHDPRFLLQLVYMYGKSAALILALTFVLHLLLRARWIALVGMHSVYPDGIRWDRLRLGPILRGIERDRARPFPDIIERADNLATTVFAVGVMLAMLIAVIALVAIALSGLSVLANRASGGAVPVETTMLALLAFTLLPYSLALALDRLRGERLAADSRLRAALHRVLGFYTRVGFSRNSNPIMALVSSYGGERKVLFGTIGLIFLAMAFASVLPMLNQAGLPLGSYGLFPASGTTLPGIDSAHYDDRRDPARDAAVPFIPSLTATGPYLPLTVPYRPERDAAALQRSCPAVGATPGDARSTALLACLSALHAVTLDGKPITGLRYVIASDPRSERPALLAMIDLRALAPGRHELRVARPPEVSDNPHRAPDPGFDRILFWR